MIMVDELKVYPNAWGPFRGGSCHLMTDGPIEELHRFAAQLGLRREWFQDDRLHPHYDLTAGKRIQALAHGAVFVSAIEQARQRWNRRNAAKP